MRDGQFIVPLPARTGPLWLRGLDSAKIFTGTRHTRCRPRHVLKAIGASERGIGSASTGTNGDYVSPRPGPTICEVVGGIYVSPIESNPRSSAKPGRKRGRRWFAKQDFRPAGQSRWAVRSCSANGLRRLGTPLTDAPRKSVRKSRLAP